MDFLTNRATRRWLLKGFYSYTRVRVVETRLKNIRQGFHFFFNPPLFIFILGLLLFRVFFFWF